MNKTSKFMLTLLAAVVLLAGCTKKSSEKQILSFSFHNPEVEATITESAKTIVATMPSGTDVTALVPIITVSEKATVNPASGIPQDFTNPVTYTVTAEDGSQAAYTVTVTVEVKECTISATAVPESGGTVSGEGTFMSGQSCTLVATPATGYKFVEWKKNEQQVSTEANYTFTVTETATYKAYFEEIECTISLIPKPYNGGTVSGEGTYPNGESCTITATPAAGYAFEKWEKAVFPENENDPIEYVEVSTEATYTFTVTSSGIYYARFVEILFSVSETKKVYFASGNLQAKTTNNGTTWIWAFAQNQWDYVGNVAANNAINGNGTVSTNGTVDLFGWSTASTYFGIYNSGDGDAYSGDFVDWGTNTIINGGGYTWFTLSRDEWRYLFDNHTNGWTTVNGVNGYMVRPDGVTTPIASSYTAAEWAAEEAAGTLFLPAAGYRNGTYVHFVGDIGYYWSYTPLVANAVFDLEFDYIGWDVSDLDREVGCSVRLARLVE